MRFTVAIPVAAGLAILSLPALSVPAVAGTLVVEVRDQGGRAVPNAVVTLEGSGAPAAAARATIEQRNHAFVPAVAVVRPGATITFRNADGVAHHIYSYASPQRIDLHLPAGTTSRDVVFDQAGAVPLSCNIHDDMQGHVVVTAAPHVALTDAQGLARFAGLPAGTYSPELWHARRRAVAPPDAGGLLAVAATGEVRRRMVLDLLPERVAPSRPTGMPPRG